MNSSETRHTTDGALKFDPVFVKPDELVYTLLESAVQSRIVRLKLGEKPVKLHPDANTSEFEAAFTADGGTYAFVQSKGNLNLKLVIRDAATGKDTVFDPGGGFAGVRRPSIHPKGERVCFGIPVANGGQEIASVGRDGKDRKTLTTGGINNWPAYSPDGKRIAFCSSREGTLALFVMNADGKGAKRVGKFDGMQLRPCWSPDGSRLCFTWNRDGVYGIYSIALDGTGLVRLTNSDERSDYAAWHPDGKSVVFVGERKGRFDLYRVGAK